MELSEGAMVNVVAADSIRVRNRFKNVDKVVVLSDVPKPEECQANDRDARRVAPESRGLQLSMLPPSSIHPPSQLVSRTSSQPTPLYCALNKRIICSSSAYHE